MIDQATLMMYIFAPMVALGIYIILKLFGIFKR